MVKIYFKCFYGKSRMLRKDLTKVLRLKILRSIIRSLQFMYSKMQKEVFIDGERYNVLKNVFNPKLFCSSELMVEAIKRIGISSNEMVLDMGTGSGILAITLAKQGARVIAIDINRDAVICTKINAKNHRVDIDIICSDLFSCLRKKKLFDLIVFNIPYLNLKPRDVFDLAICDYRKEILQRFLRESHDYLKDYGKILLSYSTLSDTDEVERMFRENGWRFERFMQRDISRFESIIVYRLEKNNEIISS